MDAEEKRGFHLKWPWNWVVCGVFIGVAGFFIGYLWSALLAALFLWRQKKRHPGAVPQGGYCLDRTRKRLARLVWSLLYLVIALGCGAVCFTQLQTDRSGWGLEDWGTLIVCGVLAVGAALFCVYETYTDLRDALCPAKSRLARSIRSQLPYPDEAPEVSQLFAMVDRDIQENGMWFDRVAIGREWILGDDATSLSRVRGVFPRDEIKVRHSNGRRQSARIVELWIVDDRQQIQCTGLRSPSELEMAVKCLRLRCPEAFFSTYGKMSDFIGKTEEDWQALERDFRRRRDQRLAQEAERDRTPAAPPETVQKTAHVARDAVAAQFAGIKEQLQAEGTPHTLHAQLTVSERGGVTREYPSPTGRDVELAMRGLAGGSYTVVYLHSGAEYIYLRAGTREDGRVTVNISRPGADRLRVYETKCSDRQAEKYLTDWLAGSPPEDLSQWKDITKQLEKQTKK